MRSFLRQTRRLSGAAQAPLVGTAVVSASTVTVGPGNYFEVTGTTQIQAITSRSVGFAFTLHFDSTGGGLKHDATNMVCFPAANPSVAARADFVAHAGDEVTLLEYAPGQFRMVGQKLASGASPRQNAATLKLTNFSFVPDAVDGAHKITIFNCDELIYQKSGDLNQVGAVAADGIRLINPYLDPSNLSNRLTVSTLVSGLGGLDTGTVQPNTDYYLYGVATEDGSLWHNVFSANVQAPDNTAFPSYTRFVRIGWQHTNASSHFTPTNKADYTYSISGNLGTNAKVLGGGLSGGVIVPLSVLPLSDPEAYEFVVSVHSSTANALTFLDITPNTPVPQILIQQAATGVEWRAQASFFPDNGNLYYFSTDAAAQVFLHAWRTVR